MEPMTHGDEGFTLIEILVAFAILVLSLGAIYQSLSLGAQSLSRAGGADQAVAWAQSKLAAVGIEERLDAGEMSGVFDDPRFSWDLSITPYEPEDGPERAIDLGVKLMDVTLTVHWYEGEKVRSMTSRTLRLVGEEQTR